MSKGALVHRGLGFQNHQSEREQANHGRFPAKSNDQPLPNDSLRAIDFRLVMSLSRLTAVRTHLNLPESASAGFASLRKWASGCHQSADLSLTSKMTRASPHQALSNKARQHLTHPGGVSDIWEVRPSAGFSAAWVNPPSGTLLARACWSSGVLLSGVAMPPSGSF
jgi:hypothetical protein